MPKGALFDVYPDLLALADERGYFTDLNPAWEQVLGFSREALMAEPFVNFIHPDDVAHTQAATIDLLNGKPWGGVENRYRHKNGHYVWLEWRVLDTQPFGVIYTLARDISARKKAEADMARMRAQLEEAQELARIGHWESDLIAGTSYWSPMIYHILGLDPAKGPITARDILNGLDKENRARGWKAWVQAGATGIFQLEHPFTRPDGRHIYVRVRAHLERDAGDNVVRILGTIQDMTETRRQQDSLEDAMHAAEQANRAKSSFLSTMSHELRTPLNAMMGFSEIIRDGLLGRVAPPIYQEYAGHIHDSALHLLEIINDVLDLSKIEADALSITPEKIQLALKLQRAADTISPEATRRHVRVAIDCPPDLHIVADRRASLQIVFNLLANAVRYAPENSLIEIVALRASADNVAITIRDHGKGFRADVLAEFGQPFPGRADSYRSSHRSTGLGLAISMALAEKMGGRLLARNHPEGGAELTLLLSSA